MTEKVPLDMEHNEPNGSKFQPALFIYLLASSEDNELTTSSVEILDYSRSPLLFKNQHYQDRTCTPNKEFLKKNK